MSYRVLLTDDAARDLEQLCGYIAEHDSRASAGHVLDGIEAAFKCLNSLPNHGNHPTGPLALGIKEYLETFFKPYRIIYRVMGDVVYVNVIADGRRGMQTLLEGRRIQG